MHALFRNFPIAFLAAGVSAQAGFTIQQALSAPFTSLLNAAPAKGRVAWLSDAEGRRNLWVAEPGGGGSNARQLTHYADDDGQDLGDLAWAPDAESIAYVRGGDFEATSKPAPNPALLTQGAEQEIWMISVHGGEPRKITPGRSPVFTRSGDAIVYLLKDQIWMIKADATSAKPEQLLHTRGDIGSLRLSPDGNALAFVSDRGDHSIIGIYSFDAKSLTYVDPSADKDSEPAWSPDSKSIAYVRIPSSDGEYEFAPHRTAPLPWSIRIANVQTGQGREVWKASEGRGSVFRAMVAKNQIFWGAGDKIVFPYELDGWLHLYAVAAQAGPAAVLTPGNFEVEHVSLSQDRSTLVYSSNQDDIDRRHLWQISLTVPGVAPTALTRGEGIEVSPVIASDNRTIVCLRADTRILMRAAVLASSGQVDDLAPQSISKDFPGSRFVVPQQVIFPAADGLMIHGQLFLPASSKDGAERRPALIFFHGGSRRQMLLGWHYMEYYNNAYAMNQYLANLGYVVLSVNYRSGIGYGMDFREALKYGAAGASEFNDVQGAGLFMRNRADVDPARIGVWGGSYGGYLTALALARSSDLFAAGVDFHGVHDWNIELGNWNTSYDPKADPNAARVAYESSPIASISTWRSPVLLIHGDDDRNVQFSQTPKLAAALRKQHVEVEELIFPDEIHDFLLHRDWLAAYSAGADFFERHLMKAH
jgi:dipeptidyl aminopeptidase/acylaminoacyl peptidase